MHRIRLVHWNAGEARQLAAKLETAGYRVDSTPLTAALKKMRHSPPDAVVIDLSRLPGQGRDVALAVRKYKDTRRLPLVMVEGDPEKVERMKTLIPDAVYTNWGRIRSALKQAIANPPVDPRVPTSTLEGYAGTPLPKKLGIRTDYRVQLLGAPPGFGETLGKLPPGARLSQGGGADLIVWFVKKRDAVERRIEKLGERAGRGGLWVVWPKRASGIETDLTQAVVRKIGLARGLVDYKIASIDSRWTGLRFTRRKRS